MELKSCSSVDDIKIKKLNVLTNQWIRTDAFLFSPSSTNKMLLIKHHVCMHLYSHEIKM